MSRVPVAWSMMPTTMNSAALNMACAHNIANPASIRVAATDADHQGDEPELADRAERQDQLEVVLAHGAPAGQQHGQQTEA